MIDDNNYEYNNYNIGKYLKFDDIQLDTYDNKKIDFSSLDNYSKCLPKALLDNDKIVEYWACHSTRLEVYDNQPDKFVYLGSGYVYEVAGVKQRIYPDIKYHFWGKLF